MDLPAVLGFYSGAYTTGDEAASRVAQQMFSAGLQPDEEDEGRLARTRWLEEHHAESSFPCGVVPTTRDALPNTPVLNVLPIIKQTFSAIIAAILPSELVFLLEENSPEITELGRIPRAAVRSVDVVDGDGQHIPEPLHETFESDVPALAVLRWSDQAKDDEERFAFRSAWMAWKCARRLLAANRG
jgi:hypothetical protein